MEVQGGVDAFLDRRAEALKLEREEELAEASVAGEGDKSVSYLEAAGLAIARLHLEDRSSGFSSRVTCTFQGAPGRILYPGKMSSGDIVVIRSDPSSTALTWSAVLGQLKDHSIEAHVEEADADESLDEMDGINSLIILKVGSDVTYQRYIRALEDLRKMRSDHPSYRLRRTLLEGYLPRFSNDQLTGNLDIYVESLNESQREAVRHGMNAHVFACIHGPPGTGKTQTLIALICAELERGTRILVAAPSNIAVDNVAERLVQTRPKTRLLRLGHPARLLPTVVEHSLDYKLARSDAAALAKDIRSEIDQLDKECRKKVGKSERRRMRSEQKELRKELRKRETQAIRSMVLAQEVVLATTTGAGVRHLDLTGEAGTFDLVIIDEAAQSLEEGCWLAMMRGRRCVMAGDPKQLPATIKSKDAEKRGLSITLMDRVFSSPAMYRESVRMLDVQYRMNENICDWASDAMYDKKLFTDETVSSRLLTDVPGVQTTDDTTQCMILVDTAGCDCDEDEATDENPIAESKVNSGEAQIMVQHARKLLDAGLAPEMISIISPYAGQVNLLRNLLADERALGLEVATVDSFQGRQNEAVLLSLVRSNDEGILGFVTDSRRINVAVTRAKRQVFIVCNAEHVSSDPFLATLISHCESQGEVRSAIEYDVTSVTSSLVKQPTPSGTKTKGSSKNSKGSQSEKRKKSSTAKRRK